MKQETPSIAGPRRQGMPFIKRFDLKNLKAEDKWIRTV